MKNYLQMGVVTVKLLIFNFWTHHIGETNESRHFIFGVQIHTDEY